jgi:hypothetical protein
LISFPPLSKPEGGSFALNGVLDGLCILCMDGELELDWIVRRELFIAKLVKWLYVVELIPNCIA